MDSLGDFVAASFLFTIAAVGGWVVLFVLLSDKFKEFVNSIESYKKRCSINLIIKTVFYIAPIIFVPTIWTEGHHNLEHTRAQIERNNTVVHKNSDGTFDVHNIGNDTIRLYEGETGKSAPISSWDYTDFAAGKDADTGQLSLRKKSKTNDQSDEMCSDGNCHQFIGSKIIYDRTSGRVDVWNHSDKKIRIENTSGNNFITVKPDHYGEKEEDHK